jgi:hypothetical protein
LEEDKEMLVAGANTILQIVLKLLNKEKLTRRQAQEDEDAHHQGD